MLVTPHLWIPPERPAIVRAADLSGLPHPWSLQEARDDAQRGVFPFPFFFTSGGGNDSFTKALLHLDGTNGSTTITDSNKGGSAHTWTNHVGSIATAQSKFGGSSYNCGATTGWVDTPDHADFTLGSGAFTVDLWFYRNGGDGTVRWLAGQADNAGTASTVNFDLRLFSDNKMVSRAFTSGTGTAVTSTTTYTSTGWHHLAFVRTGNTLKQFLDGTQEGGDVTFSTTVTDSANKLGVGSLGEYTGNNWNGYIDEFRLSVGIARWTANFTPPIAAYS